MGLVVSDSNKHFLLNTCKNILKTGDEFTLHPAYIEVDGKLLPTNNKGMRNEYGLKLDNHNCGNCIYHSNRKCMLFKKLGGFSENSLAPNWWIDVCEAYYPILPLTKINSKEEMITFIEHTEMFFLAPEYCEDYYGFKRRFDEETGEILETTREYYNRGGKFSKVPDKYPCVVYFPLVDPDSIEEGGYRLCSRSIKWLYIGEENI